MKWFAFGIGATLGVAILCEITSAICTRIANKCADEAHDYELQSQLTVG